MDRDSAADKLEESGRAASRMSSTPTYTVMPCNPPAWIEIELVDEQGNPVAGEPYWLRLGNQDVIEGALDAKGFARHDPVPEGMCLVRFPARDRHEFQVHTFSGPSAPDKAPADSGQAKPLEKVWLEIELVDEKGTPVSDELYRVKDGGGGIHEGRLNDKGFVRLEGVPAKNCAVRFPGLDVCEFTGIVEHRDAPALKD
jgi:hypothetical protein